MTKEEVVVDLRNVIILDDILQIKIKLPNELGFADEFVAYFNKHGEKPGKDGKCFFYYNLQESTDKYSVFDGKIKFDNVGYRTFYIEFKLNNQIKYIKYDYCNQKAVIADKDELEYWEVFVQNSKIHTPEWIKGGIMYQIYVDTFCSKDLPGKLKYKIVEWNTPPKWMPDSDGKYRNDQFYGGNLKGIISKLDYIKSLNVNVIYLTPIFKSPSSNRYDISDYETIDEMLGTWEDLANLHIKANALGISIVVDCVFNHSSIENPLFALKPDIYDWKEKYTIPKCWWDYKHLVEFNKSNEEYQQYLSKWLNKYEPYVDGIRLDVADCLPDNTLKHIKNNFGKYILGEVWKNAITGDYREFFIGDELDGVMNYQFANAIYRYVRWGNWKNFKKIVGNICKIYPFEALNSSPIFLSSHDIPRIPNILVGEFMKNNEEFENVWDMEEDNNWNINGEFDTLKFRKWEMENSEIPKEKKKLSNDLMKIVVFLQYTLPGLPSIFAGDEVGVTGFKDPTNRKPFPWDNIEYEKLEFYKKIGKFRVDFKEIFANSFLEIIDIDENKLIYKRGKMLFAINRTDKKIEIPKINNGKVVFKIKENENNIINKLSSYEIIAVLLD